MTDGLTEYRIVDIIDEIAMGPFGSNIKAECFVESGVPVFNGSNLTGFSTNDNALRFVTAEKAKELGNAIAKRGDVVVTHRGTLGQIAYIPDDSAYDQYVISQSQFRVRLNTEICLPEYLVYYFHTPEGQWKILSNKTQTGVPALGRPTSTFKKLIIPLPGSVVQKKVVTLLDSIQRKIGLNNRINGYLLELATIRFEQELANGESVFKFSELVELEDSKRVPLNSRDRETRKGPYPYYGATSIMDYVDDYLFDGVRVLLGEDGTVIREDGRPVLQYVWGKYWVNNHAHILKSKSAYSLEAIYIALARTTISHIVTGAVQMKISQKNLNNLELEMPALNDLSYLEDIFTLYRSNVEESKKLANIRDSLLPKLMSGEIDVSKIDLKQLNSHLPHPFPTPICCFLFHATSPRARVPHASIMRL
mgnify:CR=1 FL=1